MTSILKRSRRVGGFIRSLVNAPESEIKEKLDHFVKHGQIHNVITLYDLIDKRILSIHLEDFEEVLLLPSSESKLDSDQVPPESSSILQNT